MIEDIDAIGAPSRGTASEQSASPENDAAAFSQALLQQMTLSSSNDAANLKVETQGCSSQTTSSGRQLSPLEQVAAILMRLGKIGVKTINIGQVSRMLEYQTELQDTAGKK